MHLAGAMPSPPRTMRVCQCRKGGGGPSSAYSSQGSLGSLPPAPAFEFYFPKLLTYWRKTKALRACLIYWPSKQFRRERWCFLLIKGRPCTAGLPPPAGTGVK